MDSNTTNGETIMQYSNLDSPYTRASVGSLHRPQPIYIFSMIVFENNHYKKKFHFSIFIPFRMLQLYRSSYYFNIKKRVVFLGYIVVCFFKYEINMTMQSIIYLFRNSKFTWWPLGGLTNYLNVVRSPIGH
jgi:hypothetical protein